MAISMAANGNPYGNAKAKRVIGTLKREYRLDGGFPLEAQARTALSEAVALYNRRRPHLALDYETPSAMHEKKAVRESTIEDTVRRTRKLIKKERGEAALTP